MIIVQIMDTIDILWKLMMNIKINIKQRKDGSEILSMQFKNTYNYDSLINFLKTEFTKDIGIEEENDLMIISIYCTNVYDDLHIEIKVLEDTKIIYEVKIRDKYKNEIRFTTIDMDYLIDFILNNKHLFRAYDYQKVSVNMLNEDYKNLIN